MTYWTISPLVIIINIDVIISRWIECGFFQVATEAAGTLLMWGDLFWIIGITFLGVETKSFMIFGSNTLCGFQIQKHSVQYCTDPHAVLHCSAPIQGKRVYDQTNWLIKNI